MQDVCHAGPESPRSVTWAAYPDESHAQGFPRRSAIQALIIDWCGTPPAEDDLDEWHEWALKTAKGIGLLTRYLWKDASRKHRTAAANLFEKYLRIKFDKYIILNEGAFSCYPGSRHATLDGTNTAFGDFSELGAFSPQTQGRLRGGPERTCADLGRFTLPALTGKDLAPIMYFPKGNSIRYYPGEPDATNYMTAAAGVFYPRSTPVQDAVELVTRVRTWLKTASQSMGNWVSGQELSDRLSKTGIEPVPVPREEIPLAHLNRLLKENKTLTVIGFDVLQVSRCRITFYVG